jgi:hypothetical protein
MQRHAGDPAAHQHAAFGMKEARPDIEAGGLRQRAAFAPEEKMGQRLAPPWHLVDAA